MGMSRPWYTAGFANGPLMMHYLYNQSVIAKNLFGFYIANYSEQSEATIGGYNSAKFQPGASITYIPLVNSFYWLLSFDGFRIGESVTFTSGGPSAFFITDMKKAIIDTGTSLIYVPKGMFVKFVKAAFHNVDYEIYSN